MLAGRALGFEVEVKLFAAARQAVDAASLTVTVSQGDTVADLRQRLSETYPAMADLLPHCVFTMGTEYADDDQVIDSSVGIACIPPVSGG